MLKRHMKISRLRPHVGSLLPAPNSTCLSSRYQFSLVKSGWVPRVTCSNEHVQAETSMDLIANSCETVPEIGRESRTPSMYADEKSDEAIVPTKRPNNGGQLIDMIMWGTICNKPISLALEQMKCRVSFQEPDHQCRSHRE
jgi:hypothetical protein